MRCGHGWIVSFLLMQTSFGVCLAQENARAGEWSLPDERLGIRTAPLLLLSRTDVQADLRLEPTQVAGVQVTIKELTRKASALRGQTGRGVIAARRAIDEVQADWLASNLSGNQLSRLRQIELQWEGAAAMLSRPAIADTLRLTEEQRQTLVRIMAETSSLRSAGPSAARDSQALNQMAQSILSGSQRELWASMLGTPCRFRLAAASGPTRDAATQRAGHAEDRR
jgi:hypothetical protein